MSIKIGKSVNRLLNKERVVVWCIVLGYLKGLEGWSWLAKGYLESGQHI